MRDKERFYTLRGSDYNELILLLNTLDEDDFIVFIGIDKTIKIHGRSTYIAIIERANNEVSKKFDTINQTIMTA